MPAAASEGSLVKHTPKQAVSANSSAYGTSVSSTSNPAVRDWCLLTFFQRLIERREGHGVADHQDRAETSVVPSGIADCSVQALMPVGDGMGHRVGGDGHGGVMATYTATHRGRAGARRGWTKRSGPSRSYDSGVTVAVLATASESWGDGDRAEDGTSIRHVR